MAPRMLGSMITAGLLQLFRLIHGTNIKVAMWCLTARVCHMDTGLTGEGETMTWVEETPGIEEAPSAQSQ
jgi:hypothetical protein